MHLRGRDNILKRLLIDVGGLNLGFLMRSVCRLGTPRGLQGKQTSPVMIPTRLLWIIWLMICKTRAKRRPQ